MSELWSRPVLLALLSLVVLGSLVWLPRRVVPARSLTLLRCLVPAWRFFEEIEPVPALRYRVAPNGDDWSDWQDALTVPARTAGSLLLNAAGNLHLVCQSLIEHLVADLEEATALARAEDELVSYRLVCALIEQRLRTALPSSSMLRYQFGLAEAARGEPPEQAPALLFLSRVHGAA
jgi:hypothetical protein